MRICFASNNLHKVNELRSLAGEGIEIVSLSDIGQTEDIPETGSTLEENALQKARFVKKKYNIDCFADDTGLEVDALQGAPGVFSARYAGEPANSANNVAKLLKELEGVTARNARFRTVIALILGKNEYIFEGVVEGRIGETRLGEDGFGYDPVFYPIGIDRTFAEMSLAEKNAISHRGKAVQKLMDFLNKV